MSLHSIKTIEALVAPRTFVWSVIAVARGMSLHVLDPSKGPIALGTVVTFTIGRLSSSTAIGGSSGGHGAGPLSFGRRALIVVVRITGIDAVVAILIRRSGFNSDVHGRE